MGLPTHILAPDVHADTPILTDDQFRALLLTLSRNANRGMNRKAAEDITDAMEQIWHTSSTPCFNKDTFKARLRGKITHSEYRGAIS